MMVPPACTKANPSPWMSSRMKPSPPKRPVPIFLLKAMSSLVPMAAHKNASFWAS